MMRFVGLIIVVAIIGIVAYVGCGPRGQVAIDEVTKRLDRALGELNVKQKSVEMKQTALQKQMSELKENLYRAEARLELMEKTKAKSQQAIEANKAKIPQLQELIKEVQEEGKIVRGDKTYNAEDIQRTADELADKIKNEQIKLNSYNTSYEALMSSVEFLRNQVRQSEELMSELSAKISEIDAKKVAVDAVRQNTAFATGNESIGKSLEALSKEIEDLGVDVEAALKMETSRMSELSKSSSRIDDLLSEPADLDATSRKLDDLLK